MAKQKEVQLKVAEAIQDDINKGIVRFDSSFMKELEIRPGQIVEIQGERTTVAIADRALPGDIGIGIIRMDGLARRNAKTTIGETVRVRKAEVAEAKKITIAPARKGIMIRASPQIFKRGLLGRAVVKGDIVSLGGTKRRRSAMHDNPFFDEMFSSLLDDGQFGGGFGLGDLKFIVVDNSPARKPVLVTENTQVVFNPEAVEVKDEQALDVTYEDVGGLDEELKKIREMVELPLKHPEIFERLGIEPPKGVLLHGPPGTGKTLLAKAVANETNSNFLLINGPEIMSKYYGQSEENLRKKFEEAEKNAPSIIFIDELDAIASKREESKGEVERRVVAQLLTMMDGLKTRGKVVVIAATNIPNQLDPALRRPGRFDREIEIGVPQVAGRNKILKIHTRNMPLEDKGKEKVELERLGAITHGFVGADLASLAKEAAMIVLRRVLPDIHLGEEDAELSSELLEKLVILQSDFLEALKVVRPSALREVLIETPNVTYDDIGGLNDVKQELIEAVEWPLKHKEAFTRLGVTPPKGVLLYGPPGTGKTMLAKAVAKESEANFILVKGPELLSKWVGESEKAMRKIFEKARQTAPTVIFFDEIDSIAPHRSAHGENEVTERVVNQMLTEMDGLQELNDIVIIAATNRPDMIDTALLRPGRFDRILLVPVPDNQSRESIFKVHLDGMAVNYNSLEADKVTSKSKTNVASKMAAGEAVSEDDVNTKKKSSSANKAETIKEKFVERLVAKTEGYVGADLAAVCREAAMLTLRNDIKAKEVTMAYFEKAMIKVRASATKDIQKAYEDLEGHFKQARGRQMMQDKPSYYG